MLPSVSTLTIVRGRRAHLENVIAGLARQTLLPAELVIGVMDGASFEDLPDPGFPVRQVLVQGDDLPLAAARNAVARAATGDVLVFVDVDCIPAGTLLADYAARVTPGAGLFMGEVMYLPAMPASAAAWRRALDAVRAGHDPARQRAAVTADPAGDVARWLDRLASWQRPGDALSPLTAEVRNAPIRLDPHHRARPPRAS